MRTATPPARSVNAKDQAIAGRTGGGNLIKTKMDYGDFRLILTERSGVAGREATNHLGECFWGGPYKAGSFGFLGQHRLHRAPRQPVGLRRRRRRIPRARSEGDEDGLAADRDPAIASMVQIMAAVAA